MDTERDTEKDTEISARVQCLLPFKLSFLRLRVLISPVKFSD